MAKKKGGKQDFIITHRYRDADSGRFVTEDYAKRHPKTTVRETIRIPRKPSKKRR